MSNPYYDDEYYDDDENLYDEPDAESFDEYLCKAPNGHLYVEQVYGWKFPGQDWGETVGQWRTTRHNIRHWNEEFVQKCIEAGKGIEPGDYIPLRWAFEEDEEEIEETE